jgi:hypothetical protein
VIKMSEDITFCLADCENMKCERNKKHIKIMDIPHSFANYENIKGYCLKVEPKQNNYDRIKSMSVNEMVDWLETQVGCGRSFVPCGIVCGRKCTVEKTEDCKEKIKQWLLQEVSDESN